MDKKLGRGDVFGSFIRWVYFSHACYNYERMQGNSFAQSMAYSLKKLYPDTLGSELKKHTAFFNTEPNVGCVIHGITLGMEEKRANGQDISAEDIGNIKTGLMGTIAGLGDPLTQGIIVPVLLAISMYIAIGGNVAGPVAYFIAVNAAMLGIAWFSWRAGYKHGTAAVTKLMEGGLQSRISKAAGILGCMVLGAMVSQFTGIELFKASTKLNGTIAAHIPAALSLAATLLFYMLVKRGVSTRLVVLGVFIAGFVMNLLAATEIEWGSGRAADMGIGRALACAFIYYLSNSTWFTDVGFVTINRPFISGALVGLILGDLPMGIELGMKINLMYFGLISAGGAIPSDVGLAGVSGTAIGIMLKPYMGAAAMDFGLAAGVLLGMLGKLLWDRRMAWNSAFAARAADAAGKGDLSGLLRWNVLVPQAVLAAVAIPPFAIIMLLLGRADVLAWMGAHGEAVAGPVAYVAQLLPCLGLAINLRSIGNRQSFPYFFAGVLITQLLGFGLLATAALAIVLSAFELRKTGQA